MSQIFIRFIILSYYPTHSSHIYSSKPPEFYSWLELLSCGVWNANNPLMFTILPSSLTAVAKTKVQKLLAVHQFLHVFKFLLLTNDISLHFLLAQHKIHSIRYCSRLATVRTSVLYLRSTNFKLLFSTGTTYVCTLPIIQYFNVYTNQRWLTHCNLRKIHLQPSSKHFSDVMQCC